MDVLAKLRRVDPEGRQAQADATPDRVESAQVLRKRDHPYVPTKVPK
jgi:hypothetical protein